MDKTLTTTDEDKKKIELIRRTVTPPNVTPDEFAMFIYQCRRTGLDPLARQIYVVKRKDKATIQASIDGLRLVAQRSGQYAGQDEPVFTNDKLNGLEKCVVTAYRFGPDKQRYPAAVGVAYWNEYKPMDGQDFMWKKMPHTMLAKCAEALALRKAFPQELSGLYTSEEMDQSGQSAPVVEQETVIDADTVPDFTEPVSDAGKKILKALNKST